MTPEKFEALVLEAEKLTAGVSQQFEKGAAVAVHFMAGVWPAFAAVVQQARSELNAFKSAPPPPPPDPPPPIA